MPVVVTATSEAARVEPAASIRKGGSRGPQPIIANTRKHMVWQEVRAAALRQKKSRQQDTPEEQEVQDWRTQWKVTAEERVASPHTCYVVTINVGPRGLQACIERLPEVVQQHDTIPMALHLQDVRITKRRLRTIHDLVKRILPDHTMYASLKQCKRARRYNMGVVTLLRNDVAHNATQVPVSHFLQSGDGESGDSADATVQHCAGRVLVLKTSPTGAPGEVWHLNVYQHTSNASVVSRRQVWDACAAVIRAAKEQGAAVILGGDLNAVTGRGQRQQGMALRAVDKVCQDWIRDNQGKAAANSVLARGGVRSWQDPRGRYNADLDHVVAFPSSIPLSHRRLLQTLEVGLDHLPVSVAFHTASLGEHIVIQPDPGHHVPRLQTTDFTEQEPELRQALAEWWGDKHQGVTTEAHDDAQLHAWLKEATQVYGKVSGWTKHPGAHRPRVLKGHRKLGRELDALYVCRREVQRALDVSSKHGLA